jgi:hypothetical protein
MTIVMTRLTELKLRGSRRGCSEQNNGGNDHRMGREASIWGLSTGLGLGSASEEDSGE